jgi:hypothetical protein
MELYNCGTGERTQVREASKLKAPQGKDQLTLRNCGIRYTHRGGSLRCNSALGEEEIIDWVADSLTRAESNLINGPLSPPRLALLPCAPSFQLISKHNHQQSTSLTCMSNTVSPEISPLVGLASSLMPWGNRKRPTSEPQSLTCRRSLIRS